MFFNFFYDISLLFFALISLPKLIYYLVIHKKYRSSLLKRFGAGFPIIDKKNEKLVWVHAVSMGETKAVSTLIKRYKRENPSAIVVLSTATETGFCEGKRSSPEADYHVFLPFDFYWVINPIVTRIKPDIVILCESDFWYNFLKSCKNVGAKTYLVNGKVSLKSLKWFLRFKGLTDKLFTLIDHFCIQNSLYLKYFKQLGIDKSKLQITGNIKFDAPSNAMSSGELAALKMKLVIAKDSFVLVAGSTHNPEEKLILESLKKVWSTHPDIHLILVPRHPERFNAVAALIESYGVAYNRYSSLTSKTEAAKVTLIDTMGLLGSCYQIADLALVAGSFTSKVGGHNILEPMGYSIPVIFGPEMHGQSDMLDFTKNYSAGLQIQSHELADTIIELMQDDDKRLALGNSAKKMISEVKGASDRTYEKVFSEK